MVAGCKLALGLCQVERATVGLGVASHEEHEEGDDCRDVSLEDEPAPRACLCLDDAADLHCAGQHHGCDKAEGERHLVGDELHGTTHGRNH